MSRAFFVDERADVESTRLRERGRSVRSYVVMNRSLTTRSTWTVSSAGRAPGLHPGGRWFEPNTVHQHGGCTGQARRDCLENRSGRKAGGSSPPPSSSSEPSVFQFLSQKGVSSSGKTVVSKTTNRGSIPCALANQTTKQPNNQTTWWV